MDKINRDNRYLTKIIERMILVCLPSDALSQHLPSSLGFSDLGRGVSLQGCSSKAQPPLLTSDEGHLPGRPSWPWTRTSSSRPSCDRAAAAPWTWGSSSQPPQPWRKLSAQELMLLNCGVGEDSWESLGLQGDSISPSWRRSVLGVHWKDWYWSWNSNTLATWCEELTHWKRPKCWEGLGAGGEGEVRGWDGWMASPTRWTWRPGMLWFMGSQRVRQDWATELNWTELIEGMMCCAVASVISNSLRPHGM